MDISVKPKQYQKMPTSFKISILLVFILSSFGLGFFYKKKQDDYFNEALEKTAIIEKMPFLNFQDVVSGESVNLSEENDSSMTKVVHLWGTWCGPCEAEFPELVELIEKIKDEKIHFYLIAVNDELPKVLKFIRRFEQKFVGLKVSILLDTEGMALKAFGTVKVPETYVYSKENNALKKYIGPQNWASSFFVNELRAYSLRD
jgi:cytochrome c biogenesis protein CcmG, thiol:disulfide interchange protein DsbE